MSKAEVEQLRRSIVKQLNCRISNMDSNILTKYNTGSDWSLKFDNKGKPIADYLSAMFGINDDNWYNKFIEATTGSGNEGNRILTLHSSALLALLTFGNISQDNPVVIRGEKYVESWFEVRNVVIPGRSPSSIDVLLRAESGNLLFLESKFTEYLTASGANIVSAYKPFYERLLPLIPNMPLQIVYPKKFQDNKTEVIGFGLKPTSARKELNGLYLYGIKQCISHLIGIANGPAVGDFSEWDRNIKGKTLRFGTILYKFNYPQFQIYKEFYKETIGQITPEMISASMAEQSGPYVSQIYVCPEIMTYQEIIQNSDFKLPLKVNQFYNL